MMLKQRVVDALNEQLISEFAASSQYVAAAIYFDESVLPELAQFFYRQAEEERMHAMKIVHFLLETGSKPIIPATPEVRNEFDSAEDVVQMALDQEMKVTEEINNLMRIAQEEGDYTTQSFLQWFVDEQVEEVDTMTSLLQTIRHAGGNLLWVEDYVRRNPQHAGEAEAETE
ncbi:MAG TPA: ferritin [Candidatus Sulfomarinibacteraceae bacterium]|nr:ferritin [Candidatus Sulfomarinibacteraceae bacterium]